MDLSDEVTRCYCSCLIPRSSPLVQEEGSFYTIVRLPTGTYGAFRDCEYCKGTGLDQVKWQSLIDRVEVPSETFRWLRGYLKQPSTTYLHTEVVNPEEIVRDEEDPVVPVQQLQVEKAFHDFMVAVGEDPTRPGLVDTPRRVARMYLNELCAGLNTDLSAELNTTFSATYDEVVLLKNIDFWSICEHHWVPFFGVAHVAYIPRGRVVGISKLARLVEMASKRPSIQEELTQRIADAIEDALHPLGVAVIIEAEHLCMVMRGVRKPGAKTVTSVMLGVFMDNPPAREELMRLIYGNSK